MCENPREIPCFESGVQVMQAMSAFAEECGREVDDTDVGAAIAGKFVMLMRSLTCPPLYAAIVVEASARDYKDKPEKLVAMHDVLMVECSEGRAGYQDAYSWESLKQLTAYLVEKKSE